MDNPNMILPTNMKIADVPFQPWARALYEYRQGTTTKDDPHQVPAIRRSAAVSYALRVRVHRCTRREAHLHDRGGWAPYLAHDLYGRPAASQEPGAVLLRPFGGHWEGDSLVVDTVGFNERFWLTREGIPHTEFLHLTERFTRTDYNTMKYEATIDDPGAYTKPWTGGWIIRWQQDEEMYEYVCQDNNKDPKHMFGGER